MTKPQTDTFKTLSEPLYNNMKIYLLEYHLDDILKLYRNKLDIVVKSYARHLPNHVVDSEIDDLKTVAQLELVETIKVWDPSNHPKVWPLAQARIQGAMKDHIRFITRTDPSRIYDWVKDAAYMYQTVNKRADFETTVETGDELNTAMTCLTDRERTIVLHHTHQDMTFKQIGAQISVSESQVSRIYKKALAKLKKALSQDSED